MEVWKKSHEIPFHTTCIYICKVWWGGGLGKVGCGGKVWKVWKIWQEKR